VCGWVGGGGGGGVRVHLGGSHGFGLALTDSCRVTDILRFVL